MIENITSGVTANLSNLSILRVFGYGLAASTIYSLGLAFYRVYLSPLKSFPGPWLARATYWYEFYYDVILGGQYTFHLINLHNKYGPVIRINPAELHVAVPEFYDELYCAGGRRRHKYYRSSRAFGADQSVFATELHEPHRMRRSALNPFFSMTQVRKLEPVIQERVNAFMGRVDECRNSGETMRMDVAFAAFTADVIMEYAFGYSGRRVNAPDFDNDFHESCINGGRQYFITVHFPWLIKVVKTIPSSVMLKLNPSMASFFGMHRDIGRQVVALYNELPSSRPAPKHPTIFHDILDSKLPPEEKTIPRLAQDGGALVGAGTVTTAWALTVAVFYLVHNPECLRKLKEELANALPNNSFWERVEGEGADDRKILPVVEKLPYLSAVIQESLRTSLGVASRLTRVAPDEALTVRDPESKTEWVIPPNTPVSMTQLHVFHNARIFPSPKTFDPERWIREPRLDRFQVAFCKGSRICLGRNLAIAEMCLILSAMFLRHGSRNVRMEGDVGFWELWRTDESDVECKVDSFVPLPRKDSKGVFCKLYSY